MEVLSASIPGWEVVDPGCGVLTDFFFFFCSFILETALLSTSMVEVSSWTQRHVGQGRPALVGAVPLVTGGQYI